MTHQTDYQRLHAGVIPYVAIEGAMAAIAFYKKAFGAIQHGEAVCDDRGRVMNAGLEINGGMVMIMDHMAEMSSRKMSEPGNPFTMQLVTDQGQFWFDRAVAAGCTVTTPFAPQFWGDTYGAVMDPFGMAWAFNQPSAASLAQAEAMSGKAPV